MACINSYDYKTPQSSNLTNQDQDDDTPHTFYTIYVAFVPYLDIAFTGLFIAWASTLISIGILTLISPIFCLIGFGNIFVVLDKSPIISIFVIWGSWLAIISLIYFK